MPFDMEVGLDPSDVVLDGDPAPLPPKRGHSAPPQFSAHAYCAQTAGCIKVPLGTEVGLDPSDIALHGDPAPHPQKGSRAPNFQPMSIVAKRLDGLRWHLARR